MPATIKKPKDAKYDLPLQGHYRHVDFNRADLEGYEFKGVDFSHANFRGANLSNCKFRECILYNTNFRGAHVNIWTHISHEGMRSPLEANAHFEPIQKQILGLNDPGLHR